MKKLTYLFRVRRGTALALATLGLTVALSSGSRSQADDEQPASEGLQGILRAEVPLGLLEDDFLALGESWEKWSIGVAAEVAKLYEDEQDQAAQRATLKVLRKKLSTMEKALADRRYKAIFHPLSSMHSRLNRRVTLAEAVLETFELDPDAERGSQADVARQDVVDALDDLENWLTNDISNGRPWLRYIKANEIRTLVDGDMPMDQLGQVQIKLASSTKLNDAQQQFLQRPRFVRLREAVDAYHASRNVVTAAVAPSNVDLTSLRESASKLIDSLETWEELRTEESASNARAAYETLRGLAADDGKRIGAALSNHYFNFNLRVVASETFLNKVVGYTHKDEGGVNDVILGARVTGSQTTTGRVGIDLRPNDDNIFFYMTFGGVTQSRTRGVTDQATIFTSGYHEFNASKGITFDGDLFSVADAKISVNANNTTTGARTGVSGIPLFGGIADSYAVSEARRRKSQSEAIAAQKLRARVLPEFNQEVDSEFKKYSTLLSEKVNPKLRETGLFPTARSFRSTDSELWVSTRLMNESELGGDSPTFTTTTSKGVAIHLHESLINNSLERLPLRGRELTESDIALELSNVLSNLLGKEVKLGADKDTAEADPTQFLFPTNDVMRVEINDGELVVVLRAGLRPKDGEEIPTQEIRVPLMFSVEGDNVVLEAGSVDVFPVEPASSLKQIPRARIVSAKIQQALPTRKLDRFIDLKRKQGGPVKLAITQIHPNAGWLSIVLE